MDKRINVLDIKERGVHMQNAKRGTAAVAKQTRNNLRGTVPLKPGLLYRDNNFYTTLKQKVVAQGREQASVQRN